MGGTSRQRPFPVGQGRCGGYLTTKLLRRQVLARIEEAKLPVVRQFTEALKEAMAEAFPPKIRFTGKWEFAGVFEIRRRFRDEWSWEIPRGAPQPLRGIRDYLQDGEFQLADGQYDSYELFVELAHRRLLHDRGLLGHIAPSTPRSTCRTTGNLASSMRASARRTSWCRSTASTLPNREWPLSACSSHFVKSLRSDASLRLLSECRIAEVENPPARDDLAFRVGTQALLDDNGYAPTIAANGDEAVRKLGEQHVDLVLSDLVMPGMNGIELLQHIRSSHPGVPVIMVTGFASIGTAVEAMRLGARDYVTKPCDNDELLIKIRRALEEQQKDRELKSLRDEVRGVYGFGNIVGRNARMKEMYTLVQQVAGTDVPALILGETGTGKELVAKSIHYNSSRRDKPFVVFNCSALAETLLESELFGHEKGSFTGAHRQHIGKFEEAQGGTVFLDEIGDVPLHIQTKLLRVLQEGEIQRVGGTETITVDSRVVAATNRDLAAMIAEGQFREDLYYRLNVFPIRVPPLRERMDDLPHLVEHFLQKHGGLAGNRVKGFAPGVLPAMMNYQWRGNIRELENLIKRAIIKATGETITSVEIGGADQTGVQSAAPADDNVRMNTSFKEYLSTITRHAEESYLLQMLRLYKGNVNQIAKLMDLDRKTIYRKMGEYRIDPDSFRD